MHHLFGVDELVVLDTRANPPALDADVEVRTGVERFDFAGFDRVIVSPGVSLRSCLVEQARRADVPLVSDIDLFFEAARAPVLAVTGTNGKSTVTSMACALLNAQGVNAVAGGNLGDAALDVLDPACEAYVLELSSFQLERLGDHKRAAGVVLNVSDDHLDRHGDIESYAASKRRVYERARLSVFNRDDVRTRPPEAQRTASFALSAGQAENEWGILRRDSGGWFARGEHALVATSQLALEGSHNQANLLAACALLEDFQLSAQAIESVAQTFQGLPHRSQTVGRLRSGAGEVRFIDDSKATNVGATLAAVSGMREQLAPGAKVVLIAGGQGKGADFRPLGELQPFLRGTVLIGEDAAALAAVFTDSVTTHCDTLELAVEASARMAKPGDVVLLSPACASFDMFKNFSERGERFAQIVRDLIG